MRRKFDIDANEGAVITDSELRELQLIEDNIPESLNEWEGIMLEIEDLSANTMEVIFAKFGKSTQLGKVCGNYETKLYDTMRGEYPRSY